MKPALGSEDSAENLDVLNKGDKATALEQRFWRELKEHSVF